MQCRLSSLWPASRIAPKTEVRVPGSQAQAYRFAVLIMTAAMDVDEACLDKDFHIETRGSQRLEERRLLNLRDRLARARKTPIEMHQHQSRGERSHRHFRSAMIINLTQKRVTGQETYRGLSTIMAILYFASLNNSLSFKCPADHSLQF
jgi:hypothetical protein